MMICLTTCEPTASRRATRHPTISLNERPLLSLSAATPKRFRCFTRQSNRILRTAETSVCFSQALLSTGSLHYAEKAAQEAIRLAPDDKSGYRLRALVLRAQHRFPDAIASAEKCLELAPHYPSSFAVVAQVQLSAGHPWLARPFSEELLRVAPQWPTSHQLAGDVARARELYADAEVSYRRALELDPLSRIAHNNLGVVLLRRGKRKEALRGFQRAAELDPTDTTAINNIKLMARQDRLPVPRWARFHALLIGPGLLVALGRRITRRRHFDHLPNPALRETKRWSRREMVSIAMLAMAGI